MEVPRDKLDLKDNERVISPPVVVEPLYQCSKVVNVRGFIPNALLDIQIDGGVVVAGFPGGFPEPSGAMVPLPNPLVANQVVQARQTLGGAVSGWSNPVTVRDHTQDYPAGPPRPEINPAPVFECGSRTGVGNLLTGCNVWITADGVEVGRVNGANQQQGVNVNPDYSLNQNVLAWAELCNDPSPASVLQIALRYPYPLPAPTFETISEGSQQVTLNGLANGARFDLVRNGANQGTFRAWGGRFTVQGLSPAIAATDTFSATQRLCPSEPPSPPGNGTVRPCSALPAPLVAPVQAGDTSITLLDFVSDARIRVFVNSVKVGDGGGPVVTLTRAVHHGDTVDVLQSVGTCVSQWVQELKVQCVAPPVSYDPSALDLFPIGSYEYDGGTASVLGNTFHVRGSVYYPAQSDGDHAPFNVRLSKLGPAPIAFLVHGRHDPSVPNYKGYDYFQQQLARMGIIAVSMDENETFPGGGTLNIHLRARLAIASIAYFQSLNSGGDPIFGGNIDFSRTGLMGHSRGGEAVVVIPEVPPPAGVIIKGVLALAPLDVGASSGVPQGYAFMTILPAADGDLIDNDGARFYDQAKPGPFKNQLYVYFANHNYFNRQWTNDDARGLLPLMARFDHERILSTYGCAFFRSILLGHNTTGFLAGRVLPPGVQTGNVHISFALDHATTVDNFEDNNTINTNSLGQPNTQAGGLTADEYTFMQGGARQFNGTFFGQTIGMVAQSKETSGVFRWQLAKPAMILNREVWVRAAEVFDGQSIPPGATGFELGVETTSGAVIWTDSDDVGGLPRPFDRLAFGPTKTMLKTLRFPVGCFPSLNRRNRVRAILVRMNRNDQRPLAFDDVQIV